MQDGQIVEPRRLEAVEFCAGAPIGEHGPLTVGAEQHHDRAGAPATAHARLHAPGGQFVEQAVPRSVVADLPEEAHAPRPEHPGGGHRRVYRTATSPAQDDARGVGVGPHASAAVHHNILQQVAQEAHTRLLARPEPTTSAPASRCAATGEAHATRPANRTGNQRAAQRSAAQSEAMNASGGTWVTTEAFAGLPVTPMWSTMVCPRAGPSPGTTST